MENKNKPNKKKHRFRKWIILGLVLVVLVSPIALAYGFLYDSSTSSFEVDPNFNKEDEFLKMSVDSLDNIKDTHKIDYSISEYTFNNLINNGISSMGESLTQFVNKAVIEFNKNQYLFTVELNLNNFFKTRLYLYTSIVKDAIDDDVSYIFNIDNIVIGRASHIYGLAKNLISKYISDEMIKDIFANFGFTITPDLANSRLIYKEKDIISDISNIVGLGGNNENASTSDNLFFAIINEFINRNAFEFNLEKEGYMGGTIDISSAETNLNFVSDEKLLDNDLNSYKNNALSVLNNGIIPLEKADYLFSYLVNGYTRSSSEINNYISDKDLSSIGISDYSTYEGMTLPEKVDILEEAKKDSQNRATTFLSDGIICEISEDKFDASLANQSLLGHNFVLSRKESDNEYKLNYIVVDNFYSNIVDNHFYFIVRFNMNGFPNTVVIDAKASEEEVGDFKIKFTVDDIYYGEKLANEELKAVLYDLLTTSIGGEDWAAVSFNESKEMIIDLSSSIDSNIKTALAMQGKSGKIHIKGENISENGYLQIVAE